MSAENSPLRGVVVGLGVMGTLHLRVLRGMPGVQIAAVVDPDPERRDRATADQAGARGYATLPEAVHAQKLDFACVAVPVGQLAPCGHDALAAGLMLEFYDHPTRVTEWDALAAVRGGGEGDMIRYALTRREPLRVQWEAFLAAVRDGGAAPVDGRDGLAALSTALAILRSGERHEAVVPDYRAAVDEPVA